MWPRLYWFFKFFFKECTLFVSIQSNVSQTPFGQVYQIFYSNEYPYDVTLQALGYFLEPSRK